MMNKTEFDVLIKANITNALGCGIFGYTVNKTPPRVYQNYFSNSVFSAFVAEMQLKFPKIHRLYAKELSSNGSAPPKMASVASSSRFCYLALRNGTDALDGGETVKFEYGCKIDGISGGSPQLDAFIEIENIFIEAKCHEIFDPHTILLKAPYWEHIFGAGNDFGFEPCEKTSTAEFEIALSAFGIEKTSSMFDIKQLLCHLLGIKYANAKKNIAPRKAHIYVFQTEGTPKKRCRCG